MPMFTEKDMKVIRTETNLAVVFQQDFRGNLVTDGIVAYCYDGMGTMWSVPVQFARDVEQLIEECQAGGSLTPESKVSVTDLLALNTTFNTDEIIKLRESEIL